MGAWIETYSVQQGNFPSPIAPYMGVWIETVNNQIKYNESASLPTWERELKHPLPAARNETQHRSLHGSVSWNTALRDISSITKHCSLRGSVSWNSSSSSQNQSWPSIAPYVGAWVETITPFTSIARLSIAPYVGAWVETLIAKSLTRIK